MTEKRTFPVFRTITLGTIRFGSIFLDELFVRGFRTHNSARKILCHMLFGPTETELDLVVVSVAELGFDRGARRDAIYARAQELGLEPCPLEVGPQLRLQYRDQPFNEILHVAMQPFADPCAGLEDILVGFSVDSLDAEGKWLGIRWAVPDGHAGPLERWVFVQPRKMK